MKIRALRGTRDILPGAVEKWQYIEAVARKTFALYGYQEIRTPIIEETRLFVRSIGETSDIVEKEMYTFRDRKERSITLRPEGTAPVVRAYLEQGFYKEEGFVKLYYIGPMFRSERPQAGRSRQFHHIGLEAIGSYSPYIDVEMIALLARLFDGIGLKGFSIKLNSLGCRQDKARLSDTLKRTLQPKLNLLCDECRVRYERNVFRILDCKHQACRRLTRALPAMASQLCPECSGHFDKVKETLDTLGIAYELDPYLVRGLDYYTKTVFEVTHPKLGAQDAIGAGGRYDNLVHDMGGPRLGASGFALGTERVMLALEHSKAEFPPAAGMDIYIAAIGESAYAKGFAILAGLRQAGIRSEIDYGSRSLKSQMRAANRLNSKFVAILGDDELKKGVITLKDMFGGGEQEINIDRLAEELKERLKLK